MAIWNEPKSDYVGSSQVKPDIFNELAENEKYLKEQVDTKITTGEVKDAEINNTIYTTRTNLTASEKLSSGFGKIRKWFSDLKALAFKDTITESDITGTIAGTKISGSVSLADKASKLATAINIGLTGVVATTQSFDGSSNIFIPITAVPASLLTGTASISTTGNALTSTTASNYNTSSGNILSKFQSVDSSLLNIGKVKIGSTLYLVRTTTSQSDGGQAGYITFIL